MYRVETMGKDGLQRLVASDVLDAGDFHRIAREIGTTPVKARKTGHVVARRAIAPEHIATHWNGKESEADAVAGDWIVTALASDGSQLRDSEGHRNTYVIKAGRFDELYEPVLQATVHGATFRPKGVVEAIRFEGGFEIKAPWGEVQRAADGWLLLNGRDVYGNHRDTFEATYEVE